MWKGEQPDASGHPVGRKNLKIGANGLQYARYHKLLWNRDYAKQGPSGRHFRCTKRLKLRQLLELSGHEMGCSSEGFGLKMTRNGLALARRANSAPARTGDRCQARRRQQ